MRLTRIVFEIMWDDSKLTSPCNWDWNAVIDTPEAGRSKGRIRGCYTSRRFEWESEQWPQWPKHRETA